MRAHTLISVLVAAATAVTAGPAFAQSSGEITIVSEPACALEGVLQPVTVSVSASGAATADNGGSAGRVTILCNTGGATVAVGSDAMTTDAVIDPSELNRFTREIDFAAYAQVPGGANAGYRLASRPGVFGAWQSAAINAVDPSTRRLELDISATAFATSHRIPVAGRYRGRICVTISPTGLPAPANTQATAGCGGGS